MPRHAPLGIDVAACASSQRSHDLLGDLREGLGLSTDAPLHRRRRPASGYGVSCRRQSVRPRYRRVRAMSICPAGMMTAAGSDPHASAKRLHLVGGHTPSAQAQTVREQPASATLSAEPVRHCFAAHSQEASEVRTPELPLFFFRDTQPARKAGLIVQAKQCRIVGCSGRRSGHPLAMLSAALTLQGRFELMLEVMAGHPWCIVLAMACLKVCIDHDAVPQVTQDLFKCQSLQTQWAQQLWRSSRTVSWARSPLQTHCCIFHSSIAPTRSSAALTPLQGLTGREDSPARRLRLNPEQLSVYKGAKSPH